MQEELKWFASFPKELEEFRGKHIALIGKRVVAGGDNAIEVLEKAKKIFQRITPCWLMCQEKRR